MIILLTDSVLLPNQAVVPLGTALFYIALCIFVVLKRQFSEPIDRLFVIYLLLVAFWSVILSAAADRMPTPWPDFTWDRLAPYGLLLLGVIYWTFARAFLLLSWHAWWGWIMAAIGLVLMVVADTNWLTLPLEGFNWGNGPLRADNLAFIVSVLWWALFMTMAVVTAGIQRVEVQSPAHKNRVQYLLIATILLIIGYGMYLSLREPFWTVGLIVTGFGSALIAYSILAEDLLDLGVGARRVISALVVALVTVIIYIAVIELVNIFLGDLLAATFLSRLLGPSLLVAAVAAVLLTVVYAPIRRVSQLLVNRILFGQHYDYQTVIHNYSQAVSNRLFLSELASVALEQINATLGVERGALFIVDRESTDQFYLRSLPAMSTNGLPRRIILSKNTPLTDRLIKEQLPLAQYSIDFSPQFRQVSEEERQALSELNFEWFVPILKKEQMIGLMTLGSKRSGQAYSAQDMRLITTLADQTGLALENAALFDRVQRNLEEISRMKNLMDNVFDSIDNGVITTDIHGKITLFNRAAESILAVPSERCLGFPYTEALPVLAKTILYKLMTNVTNRESHYFNYELSSNLPGRGKVDLSLNLAPLKDAQDQTQGVTIVMDDLTETKRLRAVQDMFRRYVSPAVVDRLPSNPDDLQLGGQRQLATILFADIRGFTSFSEKMDPEALVDRLNQYLSIGATSILMYEGTLDKFMGDALMGIFNAPLQQEDHVLRAVRAAASMQQAINDYHQKEDHKQKLSFGVGLHMGEVVVGNVGMSDRMDYTAIGDAVNLAKRIQENAPGGVVLMSESVYKQVKNHVEAVFYKEMRVKGREEPVNTYSLILT